MRVVSLGGEAGGVRLLSEKTLDLIFDVQADGIDLVLGVPFRFGIGFGLSPSAAVPYLPEGRVCYWGGWGGSMIVMDLDRRVTTSYMMNRMAPGIVGSPRAEAYMDAVYAAL
jgi:CubicO group peptidase (beta-lactamase class C family)